VILITEISLVYPSLYIKIFSNMDNYCGIHAESQNGRARETAIINNSYVTRNNGVTVGSVDFYVVCADTVRRDALFEVRAEVI
jgi:hypothetical protein